MTAAVNGKGACFTRTGLQPCFNGAMKTTLCSVFLLLGAGLMQAQVGQDIKAAGQDTKDAATTAGHKTKNGTKKAYHKTKHGVKKGIHKGATETEKGAAKLDAKTTGSDTH